jgi:hypothetical protein
MPKAQFTLTVKPTPNPWPAPRNYAMVLQPGGPREVTQPTPSSLKVTPGKVTLSFTVESEDGKDYRPIGLSLVDAQGKAVSFGTSGSPFSDLAVNDRTVEVTDFVPPRNGQPAQTNTYEFTVYLQLPDGSIGSIDPEIVNET